MDGGSAGPATITPVVIGSGKHGTVLLDPRTQVVSKRLRLPRDEAAVLARREFERLARFAVRLAPYPYLRCPEPLGVEPESGTLHMTYCPGVPVDVLLARRPPGAAADGAERAALIEPHLDHLADQIATALLAYTAEFDEPYLSLSTANMIYDPATRLLSVYDFTTARADPGLASRAAPIEVGLGCFLARSVHHTVGPKSVWNRPLWSRQKQLVRAVLARVRAGPGLDPTLVLEAARSVRARLTRRTTLDSATVGFRIRSSWYATAGRALSEWRFRALLAP
jgi:hypothetical protein